MAERSISVAITAVDRWSSQMDAFRKRVDLESRQTKKFALSNKGAFLEVRNALGKFQGTAQGALGLLTRFAPALAPLGAALSAKEMVQNTLQWGNSVRQMSIQSKALGVPVARLNALAKAADQMGGSGEAVKSILGNLSSRQFQAAHGMDPQFTANMKMLGIERKEWEKARPDELYKRINEAIRKKIPMGQLGDAAAEVYGANATGILPILQQQGKIYDEHVASLEKQYALNEGNVKALTALADKAGELEQTTKAIGESMAAWAAPGLIATLDYAIKAEKWLEEHLSKKAAEKRQKELPKTISDVLHPEKKTGQKTLGQATSDFFSRSMASGNRVGKELAKGVVGALTPAQAAAAEVPKGGKADWHNRKLLPGFHDSIQNGVKKLDFKDPRMVKAWKFYQNKGYTPAQTAGMLAQFYKESQFDDRASGDHRKAYGLMQWQGLRRKEFEQKMRKPFEKSTFEDQLAFAEKEAHTESFFDKKTGIRHQAWKELQASKDNPRTAGAVLSQDLVRPGAREKEMAERGELAQQIYNSAMRPENRTALDIHVKLDGVPAGSSVSVAPRDRGTQIKSIKQQRAMQPGTEGF